MATQTERLERYKKEFPNMNEKIINRYANRQERFLNTLRGMDLETLISHYMDANTTKGGEIWDYLPCDVLNQITDLEEALTPFIEGGE